MFWTVIDVIFVVLFLVVLTKEIKTKIARKKKTAQAAPSIPASAKKQPDPPINEEAPKIIQWIPAESVSEGGRYNEPLMLEYKGFRYESGDSDPMVMSVLIEAEVDKKLVIPDGITGIGSCCYSRAFWHFPQLEEIVLPDSVKKCFPCAFSNCENLKNITLPSTIEHIPHGCFDYCTGLQYILLKGEKNDWSIDWDAFAYCTCDIFVEAPSFDKEKLAQSETHLEIESGMWWEEDYGAWNDNFHGKVYFAGEWHYDESGKPVKNQPCAQSLERAK